MADIEKNYYFDRSSISPGLLPSHLGLIRIPELSAAKRYLHHPALFVGW